MIDVKSNVKKRREERIKQLTAGDVVSSLNTPSEHVTHTNNAKQPSTITTTELPITTASGEADPELAWKHNNPWRNSGDTEDSGGNNHKPYQFWRGQGIRIVISAVIFAGIYGVQYLPTSWSFPIQAKIVESLTHEMDFSKVEVWYENTFGGSPSFIPIFKHTESQGVKVEGTAGFESPLDGKIASPFAVSFNGIEVSPSGQSASGISVENVQTGRVIDVKQDAITGKTIVIQHAGGYVTTYGRMEQVFVQKNDWVEGGELIGSLPATTSNPDSTLYFSIKKNGQYIDPTDVITFD